MAMKSRDVFIVAQVDGLEMYDEITFAVKVIYFAEVLASRVVCNPIYVAMRFRSWSKS